MIDVLAAMSGWVVRVLVNLILYLGIYQIFYLIGAGLFKLFTLGRYPVSEMHDLSLKERIWFSVLGLMITFLLGWFAFTIGS